MYYCKKKRKVQAIKLFISLRYIFWKIWPYTTFLLAMLSTNKYIAINFQQKCVKNDSHIIPEFLKVYMRVTDGTYLAENRYSGPDNLTLQLVLGLRVCPLLSRVILFRFYIIRNTRTLRKHAYLNIMKILPPKNEKKIR